MSSKFFPAPYAQKICRRRILAYKPDDSMYEYLWGNGVWQAIHPAYIERIAMRLLGSLAKSAWVADIRKLVERNCLMPPGVDFNEDDGFINLKNGMLFIRARTLFRHDKSFYSTIQLKVNYDPVAKCPRWEQFLDEIFTGDNETISLIQEFIGYSLVPNTRYEKSLLMIGEGANGKSTLIKVWEQLLGPENVSSVTLTNLKDQFHRVTLHRKLVNIAAELNSMTVNQSDYFKRIVSGDTIDAAHKHRPVFSFRPYARLVFAMNTIPQVKDTSHGFYRRLILVPFNRKFEGKYADKRLAKKLLTELDGIFLWALEGLERLYRNDGFTQPVSSKKMLAGYKRANNPIVAFVEDCRDLDSSATIEKDQLYRDYKTYCNKHGYPSGNEKAFFKALYEAYGQLQSARLGPRGKRKQHVKGIKQKNTSKDPASEKEIRASINMREIGEDYLPAVIIGEHVF